MNDEVHRTHCCAGIHGCKYGDDDCPVENKRIAPAYKCQDCEEMRESMVFTPMMIEAIYAAWHGAGVDIAGGNWARFVAMLPRA